LPSSEFAVRWEETTEEQLTNAPTTLLIPTSRREGGSVEDALSFDQQEHGAVNHGRND